MDALKAAKTIQHVGSSSRRVITTVRTGHSRLRQENTVTPEDLNRAFFLVMDCVGVGTELFGYVTKGPSLGRDDIFRFTLLDSDKVNGVYYCVEKAIEGGKPAIIVGAYPAKDVLLDERAILFSSITDGKHIVLGETDRTPSNPKKLGIGSYFYINTKRTQKMEDLARWQMRTGRRFFTDISYDSSRRLSAGDGTEPKPMDTLTAVLGYVPRKDEPEAIANFKTWSKEHFFSPAIYLCSAFRVAYDRLISGIKSSKRVDLTQAQT